MAGGRPKKGKFSAKITLGRDPKTGKAVRKMVYADTQKDLVRVEDAEKENFARQFRAAVESTNFWKYAKKFVERTTAGKARATKESREDALGRCRDRLEFRDLNEITHSELQDLINELTYPCAVKTRSLLRGVFNAAAADGLISVNPMAATLQLPPKPDKRNTTDNPYAVRRALTAAEREQVKDAELEGRDRIFVVLGYYFGLRREEALALTPRNFDFDQGFLHIYNALDFGKNGCVPVLKETKTGVERYVPIPKQVSEELKQYMDGMDPDEFLFTRKAGGLFTKSAYDRMWKDRIQPAIGLPISFYWLRHDFASRLAYANLPGLSMQKRAQICGHSLRVFLSTYVHVDDDAEMFDGYDDAMNF